MKKNKNFTLIIIVSLSLLLTITSAAIADYQPPPNQEPTSDHSKSTGIRRDCPSITVLAPKTHVGKTVSTHPTFTWVISDVSPLNSGTIKFRIGEFTTDGQVKQIGDSFDLPIVPGIMKLSLPKEQLNLTVGQKYVWQVSLRCPDGSIIQRAEIRVVEMPSDLKQSLSTTKDPSEKVDIYGEAGFWYDALSEAIKEAKNGKLGELGANLLQSLAQVEETQMSDPSLHFSETYKTELQEQIQQLKAIIGRDGV
jgi:hypothetical protein